MPRQLRPRYDSPMAFDTHGSPVGPAAGPSETRGSGKAGPTIPRDKIKASVSILDEERSVNTANANARTGTGKKPA